MKVFVYGTLRKGFGNNVLLRDATFIGKATCSGTMYSFGHFPYVNLAEDNNTVIGEVYSVDEDTLARLDRLEGHNEHDQSNSFYDRTLIKTSKGEAYIYHIEYRDNTRAIKVENGDWHEYTTANTEGHWRNPQPRSA